MFYPSLIIKFASIDEFSFHFGMDRAHTEPVPDWTRFRYMPCPGNIKHGLNIDYCKLGAEIEILIKHFSTVKSIEKGTLIVHQDEDQEIHLNGDAQTIFFNALWYILLHSKCSVFKFNQWLRSNYLPSPDPERMFYVLFSIFLVENYIISLDTTPDKEKFKAEIKILRGVLVNLLERIRNNLVLDSDSVGNGLVMFSNIILLLDVQFEEYYIRLTERTRKNSVLVKWV